MSAHGNCSYKKKKRREGGFIQLSAALKRYCHVQSSLMSPPSHCHLCEMCNPIMFADKRFPCVWGWACVTLSRCSIAHTFIIIILNTLELDITICNTLIC